ncbi:MAG TPA: hypothetical protein VII74_09340 [Chthoniobacterales bacterium]
MSGVLFEAGLFFGSLALMSISSFVLTVALERIGAQLQLAEGLLGILAALGADAPEISSSITALAAGHHDLGVGVVVGSNIFNLGALLGVSALVAGFVRIGTAGALLNGAVSLLVTAVAAALLLGWISVWLALAILVVFLAPYVYVVAHYPTQVKRLPLPARLTNFLASAVACVQENPSGRQERGGQKRASLIDWLLVVPALFAIVAGSSGIINATLALASRFAIPHALAGTIGIAGLTGIPNAIAAIRLASRHRGAAVVAECFNSNTANLVFGICLPALLVGLGAPSLQIGLALCWLLVMTLAAMGLLCWRGGLRRIGGGVLVALTIAFAGVIVCWPLFVRR